MHATAPAWAERDDVIYSSIVVSKLDPAPWHRAAATLPLEAVGYVLSRECATCKGLPGTPGMGVADSGIPYCDWPLGAISLPG